MKMFTRMAGALLALICLYLFLLTAAFAIPNALITNHVSSALDVMRTEGSYPHYFFDYPFGQADNNTDKKMYQLLLTEDDTTALQSAMVPGYSRYWHGYAVLLRPLSMFMSIANIRYLNMILLVLLLCLCFLKTAERINISAAIAFLLGLLATFLWLAPFNFQYFTVTALTLLFSLAVLWGYGRKLFMFNIPVLFLCIGSVTNFFDFLTFPVLTLGYPIILLLLLRRRDAKEYTFRREALLLLACSAAWFMGYGFTLLAKGVLGSLFTGTNVLDDIVQNAIFRMDGTIPEGYHADASAFLSLRHNLTAFFNPRNLGMFLLAVAGFAFFSIRKKNTSKSWVASLPLLGAALLPYCWYSVLQNHSIMHVYFTCKAQAVTFFGVCAYFISVPGSHGGGSNQGHGLESSPLK